MRILLSLFAVLSIVSFAYRGDAQISNLLVNGTSTHFTMAAGATISWSYDIAIGGTANCEIWYDVNGNGAIESATDILYNAFSQTDGDMSGNGGPPDGDGMVDGHESFGLRVGLAPGEYVMKFTHNSSSASVTGTVTPLASPVHSISGSVTPPPGKSPKNIIVNMESQDQGIGMFWDALTDSAGNYTISMDGDTSGNPWRLRIQLNPYPPAIIAPEETTLVISANHAGYDFIFHPAAAQVAGLLLDDNGDPLSNAGVDVMRSDSTHLYRRARPGNGGFFQIGLLAGDLTASSWTLQSETNGDNNVTADFMQAQVNLPPIQSGDSLYRVLRVYATNSTIRGTITVDDAVAPYQLQVSATSTDTAVAYAYADSIDGSFVIPVSNKLHSYKIGLGWSSYGWIVDDVTAQAGDSNVVVRVRSVTWTNVDHHPGWNMLAVPVLVADAHKTFLYPGATTSAFNFVSGSGYKTDSILQTGKGYWMKFNDTSTNWISGFVFSRETLSVLAGWNMIASPTYGIPTSNIVPVGTSITTPFFGYLNGYYSTTYLNGGYGYWIKVSGAGQLIVNGSNAVPVNAFNSSGTIHGDASGVGGTGELVFTDATKERRTLIVSAGKAGREPEWYQLPPVPPEGVMDVRFRSQTSVAFAGDNIGTSLPIDISSAVFPVTVSWKSVSEQSRSVLNVAGREYLLAGTGKITLAENSATVTLSPRAPSDRLIPSRFEVRQNYPNPFNPSTLISYDLPSAARVRLTVVNTLGQEVAVVVDDSREAGSYVATFTATNLPSGVYFYRLTAGAQTSTGKMLLVR